MKLQSILLVFMMTFTRAMHNDQGEDTSPTPADNSSDDSQNNNNAGSNSNFINGNTGG